MFIYQGIYIGIAGTLIGSSLGLIFSLLQENFHLIHLDGTIYFLNFLPVAIVGWHYLVVILMTLLLTFLVSIIPSLIATQVTPLKAIKYK